MFPETDCLDICKTNSINCSFKRLPVNQHKALDRMSKALCVSGRCCFTDKMILFFIIQSKSAPLNKFWPFLPQSLFHCCFHKRAGRLFQTAVGQKVYLFPVLLPRTG